MLATSHNPLAAQLCGVNVRFVLLLSFGLSAALGAIAGILIAPITLTSWDVGVMLGLKGFAAAILGGLGSGAGAVVGGLRARHRREPRRGLRQLGVQGRDRVRHHPRGAVLHAERPVRQAERRAGMTCGAERCGLNAAHRGARAARRGDPGAAARADQQLLVRSRDPRRHQRDRLRGPQPADRLRGADQPRPRRILRPRRVRLGDPYGALRLAARGRAGRDHRGRRVARPRRRPPDPEAQGALPRHGDARHGHHHFDRGRDRGRPHRRARRHERARHSRCSGWPSRASARGTGSSAAR